MIPELGQFALVLALVVSVFQASIPMLGAWRGNRRWMAVARPAAAGQFVFVGLAFALLTTAFIRQDFSVAYVAQNSNLALPIMYRFSAVWGAHEGSLLLWALILALWTVAVAAFSRRLPDVVIARVLGVMGIISVGFLLFTIFTSNPFLRHLPPLPDGRDLNPLLQDPGLIIHPPMLYMGYVGFSVAFAFAIAGLLGGRLDRNWVRWSRPWTNVAWAFLTLGIALGSWWAYYELGWGGWWFWDPVENASFMPWLVGLALIHSQAVTEKRGAFKGWTVLLAICAFSLSLLGTFLVRSGVLTSVHAFASDPERGIFILIFLGVVAGGALTLYALRAPRVATGGGFAPWSRESLILGNSLFLSVATAMVLLGTIYPLLVEALGMGKISVGPPYFGLMFAILMAPLMILMPLAPLTAWQKGTARILSPRLVVALSVLAMIVAFLGWKVDLLMPWRAWAGMAVALWIAALTVRHFIEATVRIRASGRQSRWPTRGVVGMTLAHLGVAVFVIGVTFVESRGTEKDLAMAPGETYEVAGYTFTFNGVDRVRGPNYLADQGHFVVFKGGREIARLDPQKRQYSDQSQIMTEAAIDAGLFRDLYVALGEPLDGEGSWAVRVYYKPFVRWIWLGALFMTLGGMLGATDRRYRRPVSDLEPQQAPGDAGIEVARA